MPVCSFMNMIVWLLLVQTARTNSKYIHSLVQIMSCIPSVVQTFRLELLARGMKRAKWPPFALWMGNSKLSVLIIWTIHILYVTIQHLPHCSWNKTWIIHSKLGYICIFLTFLSIHHNIFVSSLNYSCE